MRTRLGLVATTLVLVPAGTVALCAGLAAAAPTFHNTETRWYTVKLRAADTVPRSSGSATGVARVRVTVVRGKPMAFVVWQLTFRGLRGDALEAHIHSGRPGRKGPIVLPLCVLCGSGMRGRAQFPAGLTWFHTVWSGLNGDERNSQAYVDVHTSGRPSGAIRGPLTSPNWTAWLWWSEGEPQPPSAGGYPPLVTAARS